MKSLVGVVFILCIGLASGLRCWECNNAKTNEECQTTGRIVECNEINAICEDHVRHEQYGKEMRIEKRCKQRLACHTNVNQNIKDAYPIQCNIKSPTSTCRCCCDTDLCNADLLACWNRLPQHDDPSATVAVGEDLKCDQRPQSPQNGNMQCQGNLEPGTVCDFKCHDGFFLVGAPKMTCLEDQTWDFHPPVCSVLTCPPARAAPTDGTVSCTDGINHRSRCEYSCNTDFALIGHNYAECMDIGNNDGTGIWSQSPPTCKPLICPSQGPLFEGTITCTKGRKFGSYCSFSCDAHHELYPATITGNLCTADGTWDAPLPCCSVRCPPHVVMDFVVVMDSSSSVGAENWIKMKAFVRMFLDDFAVRNDAAHYAVIRYNRVVDTETQILLNDFPTDINPLLAAFDLIPYDGSGTYTGNALNHTADVLLKVGNRLKARDVVLLITDGASQDDVSVPAKRVRDTGALLYVLPVLPPRGRLDFEQIEEIAGEGNSDHIIRDALEGGFEALDEEFARRMSELLCDEPCYNPFHINE